MFIDFTHNKIISETISEAFKNNFEQRLVPMLEEHYPTLLGVQMYEDYISDKFQKDGYWYYPLTLVFDERQRSLWIRWRMSRNAFAGGNPYAYIGEAKLAFEIADVVPDEFKRALESRAIYCEEGLIPIKIDAGGQEVSFLSGKYSQTFIDEMARQLTREIASSQGVVSLAGSGIELKLVFAPDTYMEHTSESVTYRRLLISDKGCAPRDFWVKWTRLDAAVGYTVSDTPADGSITFEIGEDVSQKAREREYRFLMRTNPDKLHSAMSRKNVTEWREILRRAIRRGDLIKIEADDTLSAERDMELRRQLSEVLGVSPAPVSETVKEPEASGEDELVRLAREAIMGASLAEEPADVAAPVIEEVAAPAPAKKKKTAEPKFDPDQISMSLFDALPEEKAEEDEQSVEERIRAEIEAKLRLEYESRARAAAEEEAARLREENERLMEKARIEQAQKAQEEARLKAEIEAKLRSEEQERERLAEAARIAIQERKRLEEERAAEELRRKQEEARLAEEKRRREEQERLEAERRAAEEKRRAEEERIRIEREKAEQLARELAEKNAPKYISKTAEFTFRRTVDPNVTKRIYEIVKATIEFYHKEDVYIRIKASVPDTTTVRLEFLEIPEEESELVVNIIKALGKSDLGIAKATLN